MVQMFVEKEAPPSDLVVRPELVALRRRMIGLTQAQLAEYTGLSQALLSKMEQGLKEIGPEALVALSKGLDCRPSFFVQAAREYGPPLSAHAMFRKKASVGAKVIDRIVAEMNVRMAHARTFLSAVDIEPELPFPEYDPDDFDGDVDAIAAAVRRAWLMPKGPVPNLTEYAERAGCLIVWCDMDGAKIDGISYRVPGLPPMVFLNRSTPADRMRFSLAHELGHLIMHRYPNPLMEAQADAFASALLMPANDVGPYLNGITIESAATLKPYWKVSMAALIYRAKALGKITEGQSTYLWRTMSARGYRLKEPDALSFRREEPTLFPGLAKYFSTELGYEPRELEGALHLPYNELVTLYGFELLPQRLTLVR